MAEAFFPCDRKSVFVEASFGHEPHSFFSAAIKRAQAMARDPRDELPKGATPGFQQFTP